MGLGAKKKKTVGIPSKYLCVVGTDLRINIDINANGKAEGQERGDAITRRKSTPWAGAHERRKMFTARGSKQLNDKIYSFGSTPTP